LLRRALEYYRDFDLLVGLGPQAGPGRGGGAGGPAGIYGPQTPPAWLTSDLESLATLLTARNQHLAGQHRLAVASYQRVLRGTGRHIPAEAVGKYLAEIKKDHPEAFDDPQPALPPATAPTTAPAANGGTQSVP
jgi:hypothetical protein